MQFAACALNKIVELQPAFIEHAAQAVSPAAVFIANLKVRKRAVVERCDVELLQENVKCKARLLAGSKHFAT